MLRAYDKATGKEVGAVYMPAPQSGTPMTYMLNGKQYIVVAISGGNYSGEYLAFALGEALMKNVDARARRGGVLDSAGSDGAGRSAADLQDVPGDLHSERRNPGVRRRRRSPRS